EPFAIAMILHECLPDLASWDIELLATDISPGTLEKAKTGTFSALDMSRSARPALMKKYFKQVSGAFQIADSVRRMVTFKEHNLLMPFSGLGPFDIVFLRNVLIYFDPET